MTNNFIVYKHTSPSGKVYVGITCKSVNTRWRKNGEGYKDNIYFWNAIQKYGWDNFKHEILFTNLTKQEACAKEIELISLYDCISPKGYNNSSGGEFNKHTPKSIEKMKQSLKGKIPWNKGIPMTEERKKHLSSINKGKYHNEMTRKKMSENSAVKKKVKQYSINGDFIKEWDSALLAEKTLHISHINDCCKLKRKTASGFVWRYA